MTLDFEPDATTLGLLGAEHQNGTWVGRELLPIANRIRNQGGGEDDYTRWVLSSTLWTSYVGSTSDSATSQRKHLGSAWDKAEDSKPFDLDDALSALSERIGTASWPGRAGSRNRTVALAFVNFCRDRNCFTRTISSYEVAKLCQGMAAKTAARGLADLVKLGLLTKVERTDRQPSGRSTSRYTLNLHWRTPGHKPGTSNGISDSMSTGKHSLRHICQMGDKAYELDLSTHDIWTSPRAESRGLGHTAFRVWERLWDHPGHQVFALDDPTSVLGEDVAHIGKSADELSSETGIGRRAVDAALTRLMDNCMAVELPGRPRRWLRAAYPPVEALAEVLGCAGTLDARVDSITKRQNANRVAYPSNYRARAS
ncbi:hypothetical protein MMUR_47840 [Mycolicibacterium murale]|uniref:Uncharacterized protein n=1 Tax=Mycolicibacterium murale TaxID=182220 RepID=A0A7I9WTG5_9MYCO|nr:hypothetical protein [Mycolicibacterium murale]MCV7186406.1 hypothetical protein [Mycolicibacterium murale]GFG60648.1 hypothetical protein MMUR_47840 [Mycolicibacterium murale]